MGSDEDLQIEHIRRHLWSRRGHGASVMVGAGFSTNARPKVPGAPPMLVWGEIAARMEQRLGYTQAGGRGTSDSLALASEYRTALGEPALEALLREAVPDGFYDPGHIHSLLLSLPWSDVFTTNYDELLERAVPLIPEARYTVVRNPPDIAHASRPRIVKLHGSFPSDRPFIFTEEQYRTYPRTHAPFVNLVQQAIMETLFCLVGFSGDDPNFLQWIGWVHDNLGESAPPIYLVGVLDLTHARAARLRARRVIPVDLAARFPAANYPDRGLRHGAASEWFLHSLASGEPPDDRKWPSAGTPAAPRPNRPLPPVLPSPGAEPRRAAPQRPDLHGPGEALDPKDLERHVAYWHQERRRHPGWVTLPEHNREELVRAVLPWFSAPLVPAWIEAVGSFPPAQQLLAWHELVWRFEQSLLPLTTEQTDAIGTLLDRVVPFGSLHGPRSKSEVTIGECACAGWHSDGPECTPASVAEAWVELVFAVMRTAREEFKAEVFSKWSAAVEPIAAWRPEWQARWRWERATQFLFNLEQQKLADELHAWKPDASLPFERARRAALLAELGLTADAKAELDAALRTLQAGSVASPPSLRAPSEEGWLICFANVLCHATREFGPLPQDEVDRLSQRRRRLERLDADLCDPEPWIESIERKLEAELLAREQPETEDRSFDPGRASVTRMFRNEQPVPWFIIRLFESVPLPIRCGHVLASSSKALRPAALSLFFDGEPQLGLLYLLRIARPEGIHDALDRVTVAALAEGSLRRIAEWILKAAEEAIQRVSVEGIRGHGLSARLVGLCVEVIGRIFFRLTASERTAGMRLPLSIYGSPTYLEDRGIAGIHQDALLRAFLGSPRSELTALLPQLVGLPVISEDGPPPWRWREPFDVLERAGWRLPVPSSRGSCDAVVQGLLVIARAEVGRRRRALRRLFFLHDIGGLTAPEEVELGVALWTLLGPDGLPLETGLYPSALLAKPHPSTIDVSDRLRGSFLSSPIPSLLSPVEGKAGYWSSNADAASEHIAAIIKSSASPWGRASHPKLIEWAASEQDILTKKLEDWFQAGSLASAPDADYISNVKFQANSLVARVLIPAARGDDGRRGRSIGTNSRGARPPEPRLRTNFWRFTSPRTQLGGYGRWCAPSSSGFLMPRLISCSRLPRSSSARW